MTEQVTDNAQNAPEETQVSEGQNNNLVGLDILSSDVRELGLLKKFVKEDKLDVNGVVKSLAHAESLIGKRIEEADEETLGKIFNKLKVPSDVSGYEFKDIEGKEDFKKEFAQLAAELKLTKDSANKLFDTLVEKEIGKEKALIEKEQQKIEEYNAILKKEFGDAFDKRMEAANKAIKLFGSEKLKEELNNAGLGNNPEVIKFLASVGVKYATQTNITSDVEKVIGMTPEEARKKITQLRADSSFNAKYFNPIAVGHQEAKEELNKLYKIAYD